MHDIRLTASLAVVSCCLVGGVPAAAQDSSPGPNTAELAERLPHQLDVTLAVFDPGIPADEALHRQLEVFPQIREVEARFLPFVLRETLAESGQWGAVRVISRPDPTSELLVTGKILRSDGVGLELQVRAEDATGRAWLEDTYVATARKPDDTGPRIDPYQALFDKIAGDLIAARGRFDEAELSAIVQVSFLSYARGLSAAAFGDYLQGQPDGTLGIRRLPVGDDPLIHRVERIRQFEYLFTDTLDEQYEEHYLEIAPIYDQWREYRRQLAAYRASENERLQTRKSSARRGSYEAMKKSYEDYRWSKIEAQNLAKWAVGFDNEVSPTVMELEGRVVELKGGIDARYAEWRRILTSIFEAESGADESTSRQPSE